MGKKTGGTPHLRDYFSTCRTLEKVHLSLEVTYCALPLELLSVTKSYFANLQLRQIKALGELPFYPDYF